MRKKEILYYFVYDEDTLLYNIFLEKDNIKLIKKKVVDEREGGERRIRSKEAHGENQFRSNIEELEKLGYTRIKLPIINLNAKFYNGELPHNAQNANRFRIFKYKCHKCKSNIFELNQDFPDKDTLNNAKSGVFIAWCLNCGHEIEDNYNW